MARLVLLPALFAAAVAVSPLRVNALIWPTVSRAIERELGSEDVSVRRRAADRISDLPGLVRERAVLRALSDPDVEVRLSAARAGRAANTPELGERVLGWLTESEVRLRIAAAECLIVAAPARAVAPLSRALSDPDPSVRRVAATALGAIGAPEAVIGLLGRLDDSAVEVREAVVRALAEIGDKRAVVPLISKVEDGRPSVRRAVTHALGTLGDRRAGSALVLALRDADASVRASALTALGQLGDITAVPSVAALLAAETTASVRRAVIQVLWRLDGAEARQALVDALGSLPEERDAVIAAFARVGAAAAPGLVACLRAPGPQDKLEGCARALAATQAPEAPSAVRAALDRGAIGPEAALSALAVTHSSEMLPFSLAYLNHDDPAVRRAAMLAAGAMLDPARPDGRAVEPLELAFERGQKPRSERLQLLALLGRTGAPRAARLLVPIVEHADDLDFRLAAVSALAELGPDAAPKTLLTALQDTEPSVRLRAALAIRRSAPREMTTALLDRLEYAAAEDRRALGLALTGAVSGASSEAVMARLERLLDSSRAGERDGWIEALGHASSPTALRILRAVAKSGDVADRAKVAESLSFRRDGLELALALTRDPEAGVRANALWAVGVLGGVNQLALLSQAAADTDIAAAANASGALGRLGARTQLSVERQLCDLAFDRRSAVRANALAGLRAVRKRCADSRERSALKRDASARVRLRAAELLRDVSPTEEDRRALDRCADEEPIGEVALACTRTSARPPAGARELLVFVVPPGESTPVAEASFALSRPDGVTRYGRADRRGAVCEAVVPDGELELGPPAAFEE